METNTTFSKIDAQIEKALILQNKRTAELHERSQIESISLFSKNKYDNPTPSTNSNPFSVEIPTIIEQEEKIQDGSYDNIIYGNVDKSVNNPRNELSFKDDAFSYVKQDLNKSSPIKDTKNRLKEDLDNLENFPQEKSFGKI